MRKAMRTKMLRLNTYGETILCAQKKGKKIVILLPLLAFTQQTEQHQHKPSQNYLFHVLLEMMYLTSFATDFSHEEALKATISIMGQETKTLH